ncbi:MAG: permease-like cell division protein FtsX [Acidobacteriota bacterium]
MTWGQALRYFLREASVSLLRSWKVSVLAVLTIAVSLFVGGALLLLTSNLAQLVEDWQSRARVVVYLDNTLEPEQIQQLQQDLLAASWTESVGLVDGPAATERFQRAFPSLADLVSDWEEEPLPASLEIRLSAQAERSEIALRSDELRQLEGIAQVDDDRDWLQQMAAIVTILRGIGLILGAILLGAAVFTIASIIRLTAYLYKEEIAIMRLVGATEFFIRGPFYVEGFLQGLLGGILALGGLYLGHWLLDAPAELWAEALFQGFLPWRGQVFLVLVGALAGLAGAVVSLRREQLGAPPPPAAPAPSED